MTPSLVMCSDQDSNPKSLHSMLIPKLFSCVQSVDFSGNIKVKITSIFQ